MGVSIFSDLGLGFRRLFDVRIFMRNIRRNDEFSKGHFGLPQGVLLPF